MYLSSLACSACIFFSRIAALAPIRTTRILSHSLTPFNNQGKETELVGDDLRGLAIGFTDTTGTSCLFLYPAGVGEMKFVLRRRRFSELHILLSFIRFLLSAPSPAGIPSGNGGGRRDCGESLFSFLGTTGGSERAREVIIPDLSGSAGGLSPLPATQNVFARCSRRARAMK